MQTEPRRERAPDPHVIDPDGSSIVSHRRGERMRTYVARPRPEGRM